MVKVIKKQMLDKNELVLGNTGPILDEKRTNPKY